MNVYSLYALHDNTVQNSVEKQKRKMLEYTNQVRSRFRSSLGDLWQLDVQKAGKSLSSPSNVSVDLVQAITEASKDSLFSEIYFSPANCDACAQVKGNIWVFNRGSLQFEEARNYDRLVENGIAIAETRMDALIRDYRWNTRVIFDTHNSMTIALINPEREQIIGYIIFVINQDYLINRYMGPKLTKTFGTGEESGIIIWLHNWTKNEVLTTTDPELTYSYQKVDFIQNFPDLLNDWNLKAAFTTNPDIAASRASLTRNLFVLGGAVLLLLSALTFILYTAQRERALAQRQTLFLANVTHELQTPLSVILAAGENLSDGRVTDPDRLRSYGSYIYQESIRLRTMIERLLDVARSDAKEVKTQRKVINLPDFIRQLLDEKRSLFESLQITLHFDAREPIPGILADPDDLHSAVNNLIENAIKYSPEEKYLGVRIFRRKNNVRLEVEDHGIGIPKNHQKYIFNKFFRVEDSLTARTKGHGLGLSIVKDLVQRNEGSIRVNSTPGKGSVFIITFPVAAENGEITESTPNKKIISNKQEPTHVS